MEQSSTLDCGQGKTLKWLGMDDRLVGSQEDRTVVEGSVVRSDMFDYSKDQGQRTASVKATSYPYPESDIG